MGWNLEEQEPSPQKTPVKIQPVGSNWKGVISTICSDDSL